MSPGAEEAAEAEKAVEEAAKSVAAGAAVLAPILWCGMKPCGWGQTGGAWIE